MGVAGFMVCRKMCTFGLKFIHLTQHEKESCIACSIDARSDIGCIGRDESESPLWRFRAVDHSND